MLSPHRCCYTVCDQVHICSIIFERQRRHLSPQAAPTRPRTSGKSTSPFLSGFAYARSQKFLTFPEGLISAALVRKAPMANLLLIILKQSFVIWGTNCAFCWIAFIITQNYVDLFLLVPKFHMGMVSPFREREREILGLQMYDRPSSCGWLQ